MATLSPLFQWISGHTSVPEPARFTNRRLRPPFRACSAIITAGHETTAAWTLLERSLQGIYAWGNGSRPVSVHGEAEFSGSDFDLMPYLAAIVKEALRFHSAVFNVFKQAECDDTIPLSNPIITASGKVLRDRPIPKGPKIIASIASYNRYVKTDHFFIDKIT
ncbi:uncharacterized protein ARMOST_01128 [Armillaria ostoyae]|uniref:Cytochrome P450 n=1 Tax=Armillaria ostoyae TaxID=47428 RepID=A0A284QN27_ARMOS|nr:uncharacterized protein ARMOST_01128 [Armillaria ostoyae]